MSVNSEFKGCKLIKLGGSYAAVLPRKAFDDAGLIVGFPADITVNFKLEEELEPVVFYYDEIKELEEFFEGEITLSSLNAMGVKHGFNGLQKGEGHNKFTEGMLAELTSLLNLYKQEMDNFEASLKTTKQEYEAEHDYDLKGKQVMD